MRNKTILPGPTFGSIFLSFLKLSPQSFGGGYAIFPAMEAEFIARRNWMTPSEFQRLLSVASSAPGGVAVNAAFIIGNRLGRTSGSIAALLGMILPAAAIVLSLLLLYRLIAPYEQVAAILNGISWGVIGLILFSAFRMSRNALRDGITIALAAIGLLLLLVGIHPALVLVLGAVAGYTLGAERSQRRRTQAQATPQQPPSKTPDGYMYFI
ncbi:chromate transporter [Paenibacillus sp. IB182496]|uniref:Chromate transporter n=1 Tax=Paenibacillus sabuli TaxID=2772509 RepID=A0A927GRU1_9BACL|nr:chromate transporter [Paenibacillus sabuli]MBD2845999.1 chromate transporter [Paenibacillus sabuli]